MSGTPPAVDLARGHFTFKHIEVTMHEYAEVLLSEQGDCTTVTL